MYNLSIYTLFNFREYIYFAKVYLIPHLLKARNSKAQNSIVWLLDNAHGGFIDGVYQSPGKQSPPLPNGETLYEGAFCRDIVRRIANRCSSTGMPYKFITDVETDLSIQERIQMANSYYTHNSKSVLVSVRLNKNQRETHRKFSNSHGLSTYYSKHEHKFWPWSKDEFKENSSRVLANVFLSHLEKCTGMTRRGIKSTRHELLQGLKMPAIITRSGYVNNLEDCELLALESMKDQIADAHFEAMHYIDEMGFENLASSKILSSDIPSH